MNAVCMESTSFFKENTSAVMLVISKLYVCVVDSKLTQFETC